MPAVAKTVGRPAQFDRGNQHRRAMIAKINIARQQLAMDEDEYRQGLLDQTGHLSLRECSDRELDRMLDWLKRKGFRPLPGKKAADHPMARKARALWISLYHLGAVHNPAEQALEAFAQRQLKCERLNWARQSDSYLLIEALNGSYVGTLDCPALCGLRSVHDVLESHRAVGEYDPRLWFLVSDQSSPAGCMLLSRVAATETVELVYLGLAARVRGRGLGRQLLELALNLLAGKAERTLACAVDTANTPALALYRALRFRTFATRVALVGAL